QKLESFMDRNGKYAGTVGTTQCLPFENTHSLDPFLALLNSRLLTWIFKILYGSLTLSGGYHSIGAPQIESIPITDEIFTDSTENKYSSTGIELGSKARKLEELKSELTKININFMDYLGTYREGSSLKEISTPAENISESILIQTTEEKEGFRINMATFEMDPESLLLKISARYKPRNKSEFNSLDQWGYIETDFIPVMRFYVGDEMKELIKSFVPAAINRAGGFADFRKNATKTISLLDRLKQLTLPKLGDVESGLEKYLEQKEKGKKLEEKIQETDHQIDAIVFVLYDLSEDEVVTILDSLETPEDEKSDILEKF
ncbi:hypothetical protein C9439_07455, partial [archaeon SCG-AAA382B04]